MTGEPYDYRRRGERGEYRAQKSAAMAEAARVEAARAEAARVEAARAAKASRVFSRPNAVAPIDTYLGGGRKRRLQNNTSKTYRKRKSKTYRKRKSKTYKKRKSKTYKKY